MSKLVRPTYPAQFSIGLLLLIFILATFLSQQIFDVRIQELKQNQSVFVGMGLAGLAVIIMILIIWEEFLFPIRTKLVEGGLEFRNHRAKLIIQLIIYSSIPAIFIFIYLNYKVNPVRFFIWAVVCIVTPVIEKIVSGINNYNDFLRLTSKDIEYKNNEKEGCFKVEDLQGISIVRDDKNNINKTNLLFKNSDTVTIDLDEMELEAYYDSIQLFMTTKYKHLMT